MREREEPNRDDAGEIPESVTMEPTRYTTLRREVVELLRRHPQTDDSRVVRRICNDSIRYVLRTGVGSRGDWQDAQALLVAIHDRTRGAGPGSPGGGQGAG